MEINVKLIPLSEQRYDTLGDYFYDDERNLQIRITNDNPDFPPELILIHELVEIILCNKRGISFQSIDEFDMGPAINSEEPGDEPDAPYRKEHRQAMIIEHMLANMMGLDSYGTIR